MKALGHTALRCLLVAGVIVLLTGCASKKLPPLIFPQTLYPATDYPIHATTAGLTVGLVPFVPGHSLYLDPKQPPVDVDDVPFNLLEAGVFPLRVILTNGRNGKLTVEPSQLFCLNGATPYKTYPPERAVNLIVKSDAFKKALKGTSVGPFIQSIVGGEMFFSVATGGVGGVAKGGITGGVSGAAGGATRTVMDRANQYENALTQLLAEQATLQALKPHTLLPGFTSDGIVYCPSTIPVHAIQLTVHDEAGRKTVTVRTPLPQPADPVGINPPK